MKRSKPENTFAFRPQVKSVPQHLRSNTNLKSFFMTVIFISDMTEMLDIQFFIWLQHIQKKANDWGVKMEVIAGKSNTVHLLYI